MLSSVATTKSAGTACVLVTGRPCIRAPIERHGKGPFKKLLQSRCQAKSMATEYDARNDGDSWKGAGDSQQDNGSESHGPDSRPCPCH